MLIICNVFLIFVIKCLKISLHKTLRKHSIIMVFVRIIFQLSQNASFQMFEKL